MKQMEALFFGFFFSLKKKQETPSFCVDFFGPAGFSGFFAFKGEATNQPFKFWCFMVLRQASSMDLFRKQEAAERQLMEWKQVPERKIEGFFWGGIGGVAFWYIFFV